MKKKSGTKGRVVKRKRRGGEIKSKHVANATISILKTDRGRGMIAKITGKDSDDCEHYKNVIFAIHKETIGKVGNVTSSGGRKKVQSVRVQLVIIVLDCFIKLRRISYHLRLKFFFCPIHDAANYQLLRY